MSVYVDTSAFLAILDADDQKHEQAKKIWKYLVLNEEWMVCSNYVLLETLAILQHRFGIEAIRTMQNDICPLLEIAWVMEADHKSGIASVLTAARRKLSLVDCVSFEQMRKLGIHKVFGFDAHFAEQGFTLLKSGKT